MKRYVALVLVALMVLTMVPGLSIAAPPASVPRVEPGTDIELPTFTFDDTDISGGIPGHSEVSIRVIPGVEITRYAVEDINNSFDSVQSAVYNNNRNLVIACGEKLNDNASLRIELVVNAVNPVGDLKVSLGVNSIYGPDYVLARVDFPRPEPPYILKAIDNLIASGKQSNDILCHSTIDLTNVSKGSVVSYTYAGASESLTINTHNTIPQENSSATNKITRFIFELTNRYRPDTELALSVSSDRMTVHSYTYGDLKDEAMLAVISGLKDCLDSAPISNGGGNGSSWVDKYDPDLMSKQTVVSFKIDNLTYTVDGTVQTMDVAPDIKDNRTYVPIRYLANSLGVANENITWDGKTNTAKLQKEDTTLILTLGNNIMSLTNNEITSNVTMDTSPYIKEGRTMLPARWVAEPLGAQVEWNEETQQTTIKLTQEAKQGQ